MKIELKAVRYAAFASQETSCYTATLYVDGRRIGTVSNEGNGGPDLFHGDHTAYNAADVWCRANLPKWSLGDDSEATRETDLEIYCGELLTEWLYRRDYRKAIKTKLILHYPGKSGLWEVSFRSSIEQALAGAKARYPDATILNQLPETEGLAIYRSSVG